MRRHPGLLLATVLVGLVLPALARAERMYDAEVKRLIQYANRGVDDFRSAARSDFKRSRATIDGAEVDVAHYLKDLAEAGKRLRSRYGADYAAVPEATDFLRRLKAADDFAAQNPGISGAKNEWDLLRPNVAALAKAFRVDFDADPSTWQVARTTDGPVRAAAAELAGGAKQFGKTLSEAARSASVDRSRRKILEGEAEVFEAAARDLRKTIDAGRPAETAMQSVHAALSDLGTRIENEGLAASVSGPWASLQESARKVSGLIAE